MSSMVPPEGQPGGDPGPGGPGPGGLPPLASPPGQPDPDGAAIAIMKQAVELIHKFIDIEPDPQEKAVGAKILAMATQLVGGRHAERDKALGMSPQLKMVQRMAQANQSQGGSPGGSY